MGDLHFVLRHALTGFVLIGFALIGRWLADPNAGLEMIKGVLFNSEGNSNAQLSTVIIATSPIIGIIVQGLHIIGLMYSGNIRRKGKIDSAFHDDARILIAERVSSELKETSKSALVLHFANTKKLDEEIFEKLTLYREKIELCEDSMFVWSYYTDAPAHMVDWARRRRSYYYLGVNFGIAAVMGLVLGVLIHFWAAIMPYYKVDDFLWRFIPVGTILAVWVLCAFKLARSMKRDVDDMELVWALGRLFPGFKKSSFQESDGEKPKKT